MAASDNVTIVIVPGAWHKTMHVQPLLDALKERGFRTKCVELASVQTHKPRPTWDQEVNHISSNVQTELHTGRDVLLLLHSYAGFPGCEAVNRLVQSGAHEVSSKRGKLRKVVFFAAQHFPTGFVVDNRMFVGPAFPAYSIDEEEMSVYSTPYEDFFSDAATQEEAQPYIEEIKPMYYIPGGGAISTDDWTQVPRVIFGGSKDRSFAPARIKELWQGFEEEIVWIECGHTPFFTMPDHIADVLQDAAVSK